MRSGRALEITRTCSYVLVDNVLIMSRRDSNLGGSQGFLGSSQTCMDSVFDFRSSETGLDCFFSQSPSRSIVHHTAGMHFQTSGIIALRLVFPVPTEIGEARKGA
jgi:hypothetical protein